MAVSMNWVSDYVNLDNVDLLDLANKITKAGINVEQVTSKKINGLVIGKVLECIEHPDSDHLHVCKVDIGNDILGIVCGAPNCRKDLKVIVATDGTKLPGGEIKKTKVRGIESNGMLCALSELGLEDIYKDGIHEVEDNIEIGSDANTYLGLNDTLYELDLNPNRTDCNNHLLFAYEVGSVLGRKVVMPETSYEEINENVNDYLKLSVETDKCSMYNAKIVTNLEIKPSPKFIQDRLISAGMRPINNLVDISNYIMLEYGQPLHFFDKEALGDTILVRQAKENERIITLDEQERTLREKDIVITDGKNPVCIAGVMGGLNSGVTNNTKTIVIESAIFEPLNVRYTSLDLNLRSEASLRYEKGLNYEYTTLALNRACHLLEKYAGGKVYSGTLTHDNIEKRIRKIEVTKEQVNKLLGMDLTEEDIDNSLNNLDFEYTKNNDTYTVIVPNRRLDIEEDKADIIEEIGRLYGYEKIVNKLPIGVTKPGVYKGNVKYRKLISKRLRSLGLNETRTYTLISPEEDKLFNYNRQEKIELLRPMNIDKSIIRQTILPSLLKVYNYNVQRKVKNILLYEISNVYYNHHEEETKIAIAMEGNYLENVWTNNQVKVDFYLLKGIIENILDYLGLKNRYSFVQKEINDMHPYMTAEIILDKEPIGYLGRVHPKLAKDNLFVAELSLTKLVDKKVKPIKFKEVSKYPEVSKDLAFIIDKDTPSKTIEDVIRKSGGRLLKDISVFDVYTGENLESTKKSIAYNLIFSDDTKTLTDEEVMEIFNKIIDDVTNKCNAKLRDN